MLLLILTQTHHYHHHHHHRAGLDTDAPKSVACMCGQLTEMILTGGSACGGSLSLSLVAVDAVAPPPLSLCLCLSGGVGVREWCPEARGLREDVPRSVSS